MPGRVGDVLLCAALTLLMLCCCVRQLSTFVVCGMGSGVCCPVHVVWGLGHRVWGMGSGVCGLQSGGCWLGAGGSGSGVWCLGRLLSVVHGGYVITSVP